jgi:hypothetical protein
MQLFPYRRTAYSTLFPHNGMLALVVALMISVWMAFPMHLQIKQGGVWTWQLDTHMEDSLATRVRLIFEFLPRLQQRAPCVQIW